MNKIRFLLTTFAFISLLAMSGCDRFLGNNVNPNNPVLGPNSTSNVPFPVVLTSALSGLTFHLNSDLFLFSSIFTQQLTGQGAAGNQPRFFDQYVVTNTDVNNAFSYFYTGALPDFNYVIANATRTGNPNYAGVSKISKAFAFSVLVDCWGSVPYSNALRGLEVTQPTYDSDRAIYDSLFVLLDQGIADLARTSISPISSDDVIYGGNLGNWRRMANTLKLRLALNYAKVDNGERLRQIVNAGGFMASNSDNFQLAFEAVSTNANRQNPIDRFEISRADQLFGGSFMVGLMNGKNDPRRPAYFTTFPITSRNFLGAVPGSNQSVNFSRMNTYLRGAISAIDTSAASRNVNAQGGIVSGAIRYTGAAPVRMLTFAEYNFIRAEAALVYNAAGDANAFFIAGMNASFNDAQGTLTLPADPAAAATILATYRTNVAAYVTTQTADPLTLRRIIEEKYVANFGVSVQPWTDFRRTGFPLIPVSPAALTVNNNVLPRVFIYPLSEQQVNPKNVPVRTGTDQRQIFWDRP